MYDVSVRYIKLVPMSDEEITAHHEIRRVAREKGRPFAGYIEGPHIGDPLTLNEYLRNQMKLNQVRGATDIYFHVIRLGSKVWGYHSKIVDHASHPWNRDQDPLAVAVEEARRHGLKIFADAGMNCCYFKASGRYQGKSEKFVEQNPEVVCATYGNNCMRYQKPIVRDYVVSIIAELMTEYDLDGVHLDFCRWGHRPAYDLNSLVDVLRRIDKHRKEAEKKWGHPILISTRIEHDPPPAAGESDPLFLAAVRKWAKEGWVDRIFVNNNTDIYDFETKTWRWPREGEACGTSTKGEILTHYVEALKDTKTELWGDLYNGSWRVRGGPDQDVATARDWVKQGLDGGFFYYILALPIDFEDVVWRLRTIDHSERDSSN